MLQYDESGEIKLLRETLRKFVEAEMPRNEAARWDAEGIFPETAYRKLASLGLMGLTIPEDLGGPGRDIPATMAVIEELSRRSLAVAVPYIQAACYAGMNIVECGSPEQKRELLPRIAAGEIMFAFGVTEPDVGADAASVKTTARRSGDTVIVNGAKRYITGANVADYIYALVRSDPTAPRYQNLSILLIPREAPGVRIERIQTLGMRGGAATTDITFDEVAIPAWNIVGGEAGWNKGWSLMAGPGFDVEKLEVCAIALGIATAALEDAWEYAQTRVQFERPISAFQSVRHLLADAQTDLHACRLVLNHATALAQDHRPCSVESSMAKLFICERAKALVLNCQMVLGAYGLDRGFDMERYVRDILVLPIAGGSSAIQRNNIAKRLRLKS